jgi:Ca2+-binding RTX toxin-like protein
MRLDSSEGEREMQKLRRFALAAVLVQVGLSLMAATPASATPSCSFASGVLTIADDTATGQDRIDVWQDTAGQVWASTGPVATPSSPGTFCTGGPVTATALTTVSITGAAANNGLFIWLSETPSATIPSPPSPTGGPAADWGATNWDVDLGGSPLDGIILIDAGATTGVAITAGDSGVDLNNDGDLDVTYAGIVELDVVVAGAGTFSGSVVSAQGSQATGGPTTVHVALLMLVGNSNDTLTGGDAADLIQGGGGNDRISGGDGSDRLRGGLGNDRIGGGLGNDRIRGDAGRDVCAGGPGRDKVDCEVGRRPI